MAPCKRFCGVAQGSAPRRGVGPCVKASPALSDAKLAVALPLETLRLLSNSPTLPASLVLPLVCLALLRRLLLVRLALLKRLSPLVPVVETPFGHKRPASDQVSVTVASSTFLMRLQLTLTPVAKRTAALLPVLSCAVCLRCSKRIDKASAITKKGKAIAVSAACVKATNQKCTYCAT
jgi:hypothetical protein